VEKRKLQRGALLSKSLGTTGASNMQVREAVKNKVFIRRLKESDCVFLHAEVS